MTETQSEPKNDSLYKLLTDLERADAELIAFDPELIVKAELKIDAYKYIFQQYEARIATFQKEIDQLEDTKQVLMNKAESLKKTLLRVLKEKNVKEFAGQKWKIKLQTRKDIAVSADEITPQLYIQFKELIKRKYAWDKREFKKAFKADPTGPLAKYGSFQTTEFVKFSLRKGIDNE